MSMYDERTGIAYCFGEWDEAPSYATSVVYPTSGCYYGDGYGKLVQKGTNLQNITVTTQYKYIPEEDDYDEFCDEMIILSGGTATDITVEEDAWLDVENGGTVVNLNLGDAWGAVHSGGKITGKITFLYASELSSGGMSFFTVEDGGIIDFDLTCTSPGASALVNYLAGFTGGSFGYGDQKYYSGNYTLTVNGNQANGTYRLADGAPGFSNTITVVDKNSGSYLGSLSVGETSTISNKAYTLNLSGSSLTVTIGAIVVDTTAPEISLITGSPTTATTGSVTVTASFKDNVGVTATYYMLGDSGTWRTYSNSVTVTENTVVSFKAVDKAGNESNVYSYVVNNISKPKPAQPTASANITAATNQAVTVTASFGSDSVQKQYSLDGQNWSTYTSGVTLTENGTVYFRGISSAGTVSDVTSYTVNNIDTVPPAAPVATANTTAATDQAVTVTASFGSDSVQKQYSLDGQNWSTYTSGVTLTENGTVYFRGLDAAGNCSDVTVYEVTNIDATLPKTVISGAIISAGQSASAQSGVVYDKVTVLSGGLLHVSSGGTATGIVEDGGYVNVYDGAYAAFASNTISGLVLYCVSATVHSGTTATNTYVHGTVVTSTYLGYMSMYHSSSGVLEVFSGGIANDTNVGSTGNLIVSFGGIANDTTVNNGGRLHISGGGTANRTAVNSGGLYVSGGVANSTAVNSGCWMQVFSSGVANSTTIDNNAHYHVYSGGTAFDTTINGGELAIVDGGVASRVFVNAGSTVYQYKTVYYGGYYSSTYIVGSSTPDGILSVSDGVANDIAVNSGGVMSVQSGGTANRTTVNSSGIFHVSGGGIANRATVNADGSFIVFSGGIANNAAINAGADFLVSSGGTAADIDWTPCLGNLTIEEGAQVSFASKYSGVYYGSDNQLLSHTGIIELDHAVSSASIYAMSGGIVNNTTLEDSGTVFVWNGGTANSTTVNSDGRMDVLSGGTANSTTVNSGGNLRVSGGGTATIVFNPWMGNITSNNGAEISYLDRDADIYFGSTGGLVSKADVMDSPTIGEGCSVVIYSGVTLNSTTVKQGGHLTVSQGAIVNDVTVSGIPDVWVNSSYINGYMSMGAVFGYLAVDNGGMANHVDVNGGCLIVSSGGAVNSASVCSYLYTVYLPPSSYSSIPNYTKVFVDGRIIVSSGGVADHTSVGDNCRLDVEGIVNSTTVSRYAKLYVSGGGMATDTLVGNSATLTIYDGATANSTTISSGGSIFVYSGGKLTGQTTIASGAVVSAYAESVLGFDISALAPGAAARISDLSLISGWNDAIFTLTVDGSQTNGTYTLADGASGFNKTLSVVNTSGETLGTLAVGQTAALGGVDCTLNLNGGSLSVTVVPNGTPGPEPEPVVPEPVFHGKLASFTGDFAGNGKSMLAVKADNQVSIYRNKGIVWGELTLDNGWDTAGVGDFDGDGADDILRVHSSGLVVGEMSDGYGEFSPLVLNYRNAGWGILGTGDFNGNRADDVLIANPTGASDTVGLLGYWESGVTWTLINGYSPEWECVATGDFNGDGKCDMLWRNSFVGDGSLTYNAYCTWIVDPPAGQSDWRMVSVANPTEWNFLCSGDFDGNGSHDIAMINGEGVVGIWGVNDGYLSSWSILSAVTAEWQLAGVGDFNGDKTDDIAWCNTSTGLTGYWQINDRTLTAWTNIVAIV